MTNILKNKLALSLLLMLFSISAFADEPNPSEPPEDIPAAPVDSHIWLLLIIALIIAFQTIKSLNKESKLN